MRVRDWIRTVLTFFFSLSLHIPQYVDFHNQIRSNQNAIDYTIVLNFLPIGVMPREPAQFWIHTYRGPATSLVYSLLEHTVNMHLFSDSCIVSDEYFCNVCVYQCNALRTSYLLLKAASIFMMYDQFQILFMIYFISSHTIGRYQFL